MYFLYGLRKRNSDKRKKHYFIIFFAYCEVWGGVDFFYLIISALFFHENYITYTGHVFKTWRGWGVGGGGGAIFSAKCHGGSSYFFPMYLRGGGDFFSHLLILPDHPQPPAENNVYQQMPIAHSHL